MNISELRKSKSLTQQKLSDISGVPKMTISKIERGVISVNNISLENAVKLANALGIMAEELLDNRREK